MAIPEGYTKLAVVGFVNKGKYQAGTSYKQYNYVFYNGSTYLATKDNPTGAPGDGVDGWQFLAQGVVGPKGDPGTPGAKGDQGVSITRAAIVDGVLHVYLSNGTEVSAGSVAVTKDAVVNALEYIPGPGVNLVSDIDTWNTGRIGFNKSSTHDPIQHVQDTRVPSGSATRLSFIPNNETGIGIYVFSDTINGIDKITAGKIYTVSFYARTESGIMHIMRSRMPLANLQEIIDAPNGDELNVTSEWKQYRLVVKILDPKNLISGTIDFYFDNGVPGTKYTVYISSLKIEEGQVEKPIWTSAPQYSGVFGELEKIPMAHRNMYRGKYLGDSLDISESCKNEIKNGSFHDLWIGDYWTHDGINYRIADMDYWWHCGDNQDLRVHHLVIVPDTTALCSGAAAVMEDTNTTANGYTNSKMCKTTLPTVVKPKIEAAFPSMLLSHRDLFTTAAANGVPTAEAWRNSDVELMNEIMLYGTTIFAPMGNGVTNPRLYTTGNSQLALFRLNPTFIKTRQNYWLRDVSSATGFASVNYFGSANWHAASYPNLGVRPVFAIG